MPRCLPTTVVCLVAAAATAFGQAAPSLRHEILHGTVRTGAPGAASPVGGADVIVTRAPDRAFKSARTDSAGAYTIEWPDGTGDYLVHVSAVGYETFRKRVTRAGADTAHRSDSHST